MLKNVNICLKTLTNACNIFGMYLVGYKFGTVQRTLTLWYVAYTSQLYQFTLKFFCLKANLNNL